MNINKAIKRDGKRTSTLPKHISPNEAERVERKRQEKRISKKRKQQRDLKNPE
jgi:hypothetical protein